MNTGVQVSAALAQLTGQVVCMQRGVNGQGYYTWSGLQHAVIRTGVKACKIINFTRTTPPLPR